MGIGGDYFSYKTHRLLTSWLVKTFFIRKKFMGIFFFFYLCSVYSIPSVVRPRSAVAL